MRAKDLITGLNEAENIVPPDHPLGTPPPGRSYPEMPPQRLPRRPGRGGPGGPSEGPADAPGGQFSGKELDQVKDLLILMLSGLMGSDMDKQIALKLMKREPLDRGELSHIVDEVANHVPDLPPTHRGLMEKLYKLSQNG